MNSSGKGAGKGELFPYDRWQQVLVPLAKEYESNLPFPHICLRNFLGNDLIRKLALEFPGPRESSWISYHHYNESKLAKNDRDAFPTLIGKVIDELNSPEFVSWLSQLTGISGLVADPTLNGGGLHQTESGGFLNLHADFSHHGHRRLWRRRCNLLLYLNEDWQEQWGGAIELWDRERRTCVAKFPPLLDNAVIFSTGPHSFHGYPDPIRCPANVTRKSLALYYYTLDEQRAVPRSTTYYARPGESSQAIFIWIDNRLLAVYGWLKRVLRLSDGFFQSRPGKRP